MKKPEDIRAERQRYGYIAVSCDNCDGDAWVHEHYISGRGEKPRSDLTITKGQYVQTDGGLCLNLTGGYGEFCDDIRGDLAAVVLCHDCAVAVARALPGVFSSGHHSMSGPEIYARDGGSCCEFAWQIHPEIPDVTQSGDGKGGWITVARDGH